MDFGMTVAKDIKLVEKNVQLCLEGSEQIVFRKRKAGIERQEQMKKICSSFNSSFTNFELLEYLRTIARVTSRTLGNNDDMDDDEGL